MAVSKISDPTIHTDSQTRRLYANDASMYEELPEAVAFPKNIKEIQSIVRQAAEEQFTITPRSAGTSLAGQTTGDGVIVDVSRHMTQIKGINADQRFARVQPGVIRDTLNRQATAYNLQFGPDTATTNRCMLGGMMGNNSCGLFSIKHKTTREHVLEIEAVLSDGSSAVFKPLTPDELEQKKQLKNLEGHIYRSILKLVEENRAQILDAYPHPDIIRRNTGYALDRLCEMQPFQENGRPFNMAELLCGSEGTLAMTTSAKLNLVPLDPHRAVLTPHFSSVKDAMHATVETVKHEPAAVELVDDIILEATKKNIEQRKNRFFLQGEPKCILIIQFEGEDQKELIQKAETLKKQLVQKSGAEAVPILKEEDKMDRVWNLRKAGLGLLMGLGSDERTPSFCEDTAVRVQDLPDYVEDFQQLLDNYNTHCCFYGHASVGELHLRPVIDYQTDEGIQKMQDMADDIASLVHEYGGSLSGEHGDGRARAPYIEKVLGKEMLPLLQKVKEIWDPNYIFNPGKIVQPKPIQEDLRIASGSTDNKKIESQFEWRKEGSFAEALDLCNGAGVCRKMAESGGTMCPSYMATKEEKDSTRGRANLFRQLFAGKGPDAFESEELHDALDLCISCKGCKSECPANVDMARMKAEFMQGWHERNGISLSERFFAQAGTFYPLASLWPAFSNWMMQLNPVKELLFQVFNISKERTLPEFAEQTFKKWFENRTSSDGRVRRQTGKRKGNPEPVRPQSQRSDRVALLIDLFTDYHNPEIGKAAVNVLERLGFEVVIPDITETGRPQLSKGMVKHAKKVAIQNIPELYNYAEKDIPVIGLEPSEILTVRDEYLDLCPDELYEKAQTAAKNSFQFDEFIVNHLSDHPEKKELFSNTKRTVHLQGHCHSKALVGLEPTQQALSAAGYKPEPLQTGCCGMAGSFGYEADHYELSMDIGDLILFPLLQKKNEEELVCAPGFSCRHQISHGTEREALHPAQLLDRALR